MKIQKLPDQNIKNNKLPAQAVVIQLLDKASKHLAFVACHHEKIFALFDSENDRETSHFLEEISNFEAEILQNFFRLDDEIKQKFGGFTGDLLITDKRGEIFYHERPVPISKKAGELYAVTDSTDSCRTSRSSTG